MKIKDVEKIALIDADSLIYYCAMSSKESTITLESAIEDFDNRVFNMVYSGGCSHYILFTSPNNKQIFRHNISNIYKNNRPFTVFPPVFYGLKGYIKQKPSYVNTCFEADDSVGLFNTYLNKKKIKNTIYSPDKDVLKQIPGIHYNYGKNKIIKTSEEESFKFLYKQTLMGDSTDNISGIVGIGEKKSTKYLEKVSKEEMPYKCLDIYIKEYGHISGIHNFIQNFKLVYILKTPQDVLRECNLRFDDTYFEYILFGDEKNSGYLVENISKW